MQEQLSERQIAANRANALKPTGPRTVEGKSISGRNALRHGAEGPLELRIARSIAKDEWRLNRIRTGEQDILAMGCDEPEAGIETEDPAIHAVVTQAARLRALQAEREAVTQRALTETRYLTAQAIAAGQAWDSAPDFPARRGFVPDLRAA